MLSLRAIARNDGIVRSGNHLRASQNRQLHTATVTDSDISRLASNPRHKLTLAELCGHGRPPLSEQALLNSANFTLRILPTRLAHRIQSLRALPYIVVANPNVNKIHDNYVHSLSTLLPYAERSITTLQEEIQFTEAMADLVQTHANTIALLARGFLEARKYISKEEITKFLDQHLRARIGTRLIAEQHLALHFSSKPHSDLAAARGSHERRPPPDSSYIGVIDTALRPVDIIRSCEHTVGEICELKYGVRPTIRIIGKPETTIAHIPMHLEYILTEVLKNSFRATIEAGMEREPIEITIAPAPTSEPQVSGLGNRSAEDPSQAQKADRDTASSSDGDRYEDALKTTASADIQLQGERTPGVTIRIRDRGGGISPEVYPKLWEYGFTTFNEDEIMDKVSGGQSGASGLDALSGNAASGSSLAGLGYGLPLGRAYAEYFGGGIAVQSLWGWGTDVYVSLKGVGRI